MVDSSTWLETVNGLSRSRRRGYGGVSAYLKPAFLTSRLSSEGAIGCCRRRKPPERATKGCSPEGAEGTLCACAPSGLGDLLPAIRRLTPPAKTLRPFGT